MFSKRRQPRNNLPSVGPCRIARATKACHLELAEKVVEMVFGLSHEPDRGSDYPHGPHHVGLPLR